MEHSLLLAIVEANKLQRASENFSDDVLAAANKAVQLQKQAASLHQHPATLAPWPPMQVIKP